MQRTVWTVTSDTDCGSETTVHATEQAAYEELRRRFVKTASQDSRFEYLISTRAFPELMAWVLQESERNGCDSYSVRSHTLEINEPPHNPALDAAYREAANSEYSDEGRLEIDSDAVVSYGDDDGDDVAAWVWVYRRDLPLTSHNGSWPNEAEEEMGDKEAET